MTKALEPIRTVPALLDYCQVQFAQRDAFRWRTGEDNIQSATYAGFVGQVRTLAAYFAAETSPGAHIGIVGTNSYQWLLGWFGAVCAGRTVVPLDPQLTKEDYLNLLEQSDSELLLYAKDFDDVGAAFKRSICLDKLPVQEGAAGWPCDVQQDDLAAIVFTSGTMGKSKGVMLSHWNFISNSISGPRHMNAGAQDTLAAMPFYHTIGITPAIIACLAIGSMIAICGGVKYFKKDLETFRPQNMIAVPLVAQNMYQQVWATAEKSGKAKALRMMVKVSDGLRKIGVDLRPKLFKPIHEAFGGRLEWMLCGGAPVPVEVVTGFASFGIDCLPVYGATECAPGISMNKRGKGGCKPASVGVALDCNEIKVVDGEIWIRGDNVSSGYYKDEEATAESFTADGWYKSGDLGEFDTDNFLYITGRLKNLIILSNGKNVSPETIEQKITDTLAYVKEALVYEFNGEIAAELFLDEEATGAASRLEADIAEINRQLPLYQRIANTKVRDTEFPKTSTKKIKRK